jgi:acyl carrier protein
MLAEPRVRAVIEPLAAEGRLARTVMTDLEVGSLTHSRRDFDSYLRGLSVFGLIAATGEHFQRALQVQRLIAPLGERGQSIPKLVAAAVAEISDLTLLHCDRIFDEIAELTGQRCEWVTKHGSQIESASSTERAREARRAGGEETIPSRRARGSGLASSAQEGGQRSMEGVSVSESQTAKMGRAEVFELVRTQLADILEISPDKITESSSFSEDLDADSLALIELVESLEEELRNQVAGFRIDDEDLEDLRTVRDAVDYVTAKLEAA